MMNTLGITPVLCIKIRKTALGTLMRQLTGRPFDDYHLKQEMADTDLEELAKSFAVKSIDKVYDIGDEAYMLEYTPTDSDKVITRTVFENALKEEYGEINDMEPEGEENEMTLNIMQNHYKAEARAFAIKLRKKMVPVSQAIFDKNSFSQT